MIPLRTSQLDRIVAACSALLLAAAATVAGCGGGVGVGGTGAYASGPITGFGSIIVNGIEFDDRSARVLDEDGAASSRDALRLGMYAEVEGGALGGSSTAPTATASTVRFSSELVGPAASVNPAGSSLSVLGQAVKVTAATVYDDALPNGLASVADGAVVEVYGYPDATGYTATRIEPRNGSVPFFKIRGVVGALSMAARTFSIGAAGFSFTGAPAGLADGAVVRLRVATTPVAGRWLVQVYGDGKRRLPDTDEARLRGPITAFTSSRAFSVDGRAVDASSARFPDGEGGLALGVKVQVEGASVAGVLRATEVRIDDNGGAIGGNVLKGSIESHQPPQQTFVLRGVTVYYGAPAVQFEDGAASDIAPGVVVEVRGAPAGNGSRLLATRIRIVRKP